MGTIKHATETVVVWMWFSDIEVCPFRKINEIIDRYQYMAILGNTMLRYVEENLPVIELFHHNNSSKPIMWQLSSELNPNENLWETVDEEIRSTHIEKFKNFEGLYVKPSKSIQVTAIETG